MSASHRSLLNGYPSLARWYENQRLDPNIPPVERFALVTCATLDQPIAASIQNWIKSFVQLVEPAPDAREDFLAADTIFQRHEVALSDLMGDLAEVAIKTDCGEIFQRAMQTGADRTGLVMLRFLSAWTALNAGKLTLCIEECEKVDEPFAAIHTLHGQALLEQGRAREAVEVLGVATELAPHEILGWFQKAKGLHVLKRHAEAIAALKTCQQLAPQSDEVRLYMAMVAAEAPAAPELWTTGHAALRARHERIAHAPLATLTLLRLATLIDDRSDAMAILGEARWSHELPREALVALAPTLRSLNERGWMDVASTLLTKITPAS